MQHEAVYRCNAKTFANPSAIRKGKDTCRARDAAAAWPPQGSVASLAPNKMKQAPVTRSIQRRAC
jgi:hypothetical protein